jgi:hypothetical protein
MTDEQELSFKAGTKVWVSLDHGRLKLGGVLQKVNALRSRVLLEGRGTTLVDNGKITKRHTHE